MIIVEKRLTEAPKKIGNDLRKRFDDAFRTIFDDIINEIKSQTELIDGQVNSYKENLRKELWKSFSSDSKGVNDFISGDINIQILNNKTPKEYIKEAIIKKFNLQDKVNIETNKPELASDDVKTFEKSFIDTFYNKKDVKKAINDLKGYLEKKGRIRIEFLTTRYNDIYKNDPDIAKNTVVWYLQDPKNNNIQLVGTLLNHKDSKFVNDFIKSMSFESLSDSNNVFLQLFSPKNPHQSEYYERCHSDNNIFSKLFNISAKYEGNKGFINYSRFKGIPGKTSPIILNDNLYKIKTPSDIEALVQYDMSLGEDGGVMEGENITKRQILNDAITQGKWESYARGQKNSEQEKDKEEGTGKYKTSKSDQQISDDFTKELKGKDPTDLENIFSKVLNNSGVNNPALTKSIVNSIVKAKKA